MGNTKLILYENTTEKCTSKTYYTNWSVAVTKYPFAVTKLFSMMAERKKQLEYRAKQKRKVFEIEKGKARTACLHWQKIPIKKGPPFTAAPPAINQKKEKINRRQHDLQHV
jgi:hypothetical protein